MIDIVKKRVIDWDLQLRKERDFNEKFGTSLTLSQIKELTGSFRRLTEKSKTKIGKNILEQCEEFYLSLDTFKQNQYTEICKNRSAAFFRIGKEPKKDPTTEQDYIIYKKWDDKLKEFKSDNKWEDFNS
tara:strand:+ start:241 stop:627 length:387 start_codon:yes stop_codon:yes gene_type:complete